MGIRSDLSLFTTAIREYPITPEIRGMLVSIASKIAESTESSAREKISALKLLLEADKHNASEQRNQIVLMVKGIAEKYGLLDLFEQ